MCKLSLDNCLDTGDDNDDADAEVSDREHKEPGIGGGAGSSGDIYAARADEPHAGLLPPELPAEPSPTALAPAASTPMAAVASTSPALPSPTSAPMPLGPVQHAPRPSVLPGWMKYEPTGSASGIFANVTETGPTGAQDRIGIVHKVRAGSFRMTCKRHSRCSVWLTLKGKSDEQGLQDLCDWVQVASANSERVGEDEHWRRGVALKRSYGMATN